MIRIVEEHDEFSIYTNCHQENDCYISHSVVEPFNFGVWLKTLMSDAMERWLGVAERYQTSGQELQN